MTAARHYSLVVINVGSLVFGPVERLLNILECFLERIIFNALQGAKLLSLAIHEEVTLQQAIKILILGSN